jgi:tetraacyldisaccharide 4'-kinase
MQRPGLDAGIPVLCVGNYHTGGAGKTTTVLALTRLLRDLGETPVVLSRGYGGRLRGPVMVDPARHVAADVGDEPLMLARTVPVAVARPSAASPWRRRAPARRDDDGFQNPASSGRLAGRDRRQARPRQCLFPRVRCAFDRQLAAPCATVIGDGAAARRSPPTPRGLVGAVGAARTRPRWRARGKRVLAFAGIGDPARFPDAVRRGIEWSGSAPSPIITRIRKARSRR